jgi:hypothetical protein
MRRPSFLEGVGVALVASVAGALAYAALTLVAVPGAVLRLVVVGLGLAYLLYLLGRSEERVGRVTAVAAWALAAVLLWLAEPPLGLYLLGHATIVWLVRSLYFHAGILPALADLGLSGLGFVAAIGAAVQTGSLLLSLWSYFLVQALFTAIPTRAAGGTAPVNEDDAFERAHRVAEAAVRRLSAID